MEDYSTFLDPLKTCLVDLEYSAELGHFESYKRQIYLSFNHKTFCYIIRSSELLLVTETLNYESQTLFGYPFKIELIPDGFIFIWVQVSANRGIAKNILLHKIKLETKNL